MSFNVTLEGIEFFSDLSKQERRRMDSLMTSVRIEEGRVLTREGSQGREFMIISEGSATVSRRGQEVARLGPGDFFGELSLVADIPRTATVTAETEMVVNALNRREFATMLDGNPALANKILVGAVRRLASLDNRVVA